MQWEFPGRLGPSPGRYVVRRFAGDDVREVIVIGEGVAPRRRGRREVAGTVPVTRVTMVDAEAVEDEAAAAWLRDAEAGDVRTLAWLLSAYRVAAADPFAGDVDPARAVALRVGYGTGAEVAEGRWTAVRELPVPERPEPRKRSKHRPGRPARRAAGRPRRRLGVRGTDAPRPRGPRPRPVARSRAATRGGARSGDRGAGGLGFARRSRGAARRAARLHGVRRRARLARALAAREVERLAAWRRRCGRRVQRRSV